MTELWTTGIAHADHAPRMAARAEAAGWDGMTVVDSQNLSGDTFVALALAAEETSDLLLGTGVTNPATRHPAACAAGIASVHVASGGRAAPRHRPRRLGARPPRPRPGDGRRPRAPTCASCAPTCAARRCRSPTCARTSTPTPSPVATLGLADTAGAEPHALAADAISIRCRSRWSPPARRCSSSPGAIADRVLLAVGADPERVGWAIGPRPRRRGDPLRRVRQRRRPPRRRHGAHARRRRDEPVRPVLGDGRQACARRSTPSPRRCCTRCTTPTT